MCEIIFTSDKEFFDNIGEEETKRYFEEGYKFVCNYKNLGEENIISAVVHLDEGVPHMHLVFVPVVHTKDKESNDIDKVCSRDFWKGRDSYRILQNNFYNYIKLKKFKKLFKYNYICYNVKGGNKMLKIQKNEFEKYFKRFNTEDENLLRKYYHSIRVMERSIKIASSLNLSNELIEIIGTAGLLHDIGRFEQWKNYGTYSDLSSVDHAELGVEILKRDNYIKNYISNENYVNIIYKAVYEHNKNKISENLSYDEEIFCKIIRDADKLDILETQGNSIQSDVICHRKYFENIYNKQCCVNSKDENEADKIIRMLCFIYDINFQYSIRYIKDRNIIHNKLQLLKNNCPEDIKLDDIEQELNNYLIFF